MRTLALTVICHHSIHGRMFTDTKSQDKTTLTSRLAMHGIQLFCQWKTNGCSRVVDVIGFAVALQPFAKRLALFVIAESGS